jgi:prepilin-type N-terminal cleavage/methylation domain-containing protein
MVRRILARRPRLRAQTGFTLIELMFTMSIGTIILGSGMMITIRAQVHNGEVANRTDATQRGRLALEKMEQLLRSEVCSTASSYPVIAATASSVTFYADLTAGTTPVIRHTLSYDPATKRLTDVSVVGSAADPQTFTAAAKSSVLATDIVPDATNAIFRYYKYPATAPATGPLQPNVEMVPGAGGLSANDLGDISRVDLDFLAQGATRTTNRIKAQMQDQVFVRLADPNSATTFDPSCT